MSDTYVINNIEENSNLYEILKNCVNFKSYESLPSEDYNDVVCELPEYPSTIYLDNCQKMISTNNVYSVSGNISNGSYSSEDSLGDNILEENGRISLAYENLRTIPRRIAEKFAMQTKFLDLSYNNFQNLSFLTFFEDLHTLILDRNTNLEVNSLPFLPNLKILWINNCDIKNIVDWIQRIRSQCPALEYLSIMGNPGTKEPFNYCSLNIYTMDPLILPAGMITDYREYILQMLPNLEYLDGISRASLSSTNHSITNGGHINSSPSPASSRGNGSSSHSRDNRKISPSLSFKDLFRINRRKKSYPSSSTN
ncbi:leucine-rich melanocyte differentiation-associated protein [Musca domestica]|uniref:Leucine-rich repeat-containing protein C10orf11 homolog n=1 Tax=Musca domestica TaxID=7370 RepID=A0A1I8NIQ8_MUSDO|nr:leucine-rich melanocyte differentiation-associated protein [Musca domestica]